jgi:hypothetical protein
MISSIFQQLTIEDWRRCRHIGLTIFQLCIPHLVTQSK